MFFILTGYKFRPGCNNPYFKVEEEDLAEVVSKTAITEKVQKRKDKSGEKKVKKYPELPQDKNDPTHAIMPWAMVYF